MAVTNPSTAYSLFERASYLYWRMGISGSGGAVFSGESENARSSIKEVVLDIFRMLQAGCDAYRLYGRGSGGAARQNEV